MSENPKDATAFDLAELDAADESRMTVIANGRQTDWVWTFAGPGHPNTVAQSNRLSRERLQRERAIEQTIHNGRKWKAPDESPDEVLSRNVEIVVERLLGWSPVKLNGDDYSFSPENARKLLLDRRKSALLIQALEFLGDEAAFMRRSARN